MPRACQPYYARNSIWHCHVSISTDKWRIYERACLYVVCRANTRSHTYAEISSRIWRARLRVRVVDVVVSTKPPTPRPRSLFLIHIHWCSYKYEQSFGEIPSFLNKLCKNTLNAIIARIRRSHYFKQCRKYIKLPFPSFPDQ